jgi:hypothetical protein
MIETLENGNIFYQNGNKVWGPIEVTPNQFLLHLSDCSQVFKFPKTEQGLRAAITDAREIENGIVLLREDDVNYSLYKQLFRLDSGHVWA